MDSHHLREIRALSEFLEAEALGLPFDRERARELVHTLSQHHPSIGNSLRLISDRLSGDNRA